MIYDDVCRDLRFDPLARRCNRARQILATADAALWARIFNDNATVRHALTLARASTHRSTTLGVTV